jgi:hypothetical protein
MQQFTQHLYNPRLYPLEVGRLSARKFTKRQLATAKRNRKKLSDALKKAPKAPPLLGPLGQAYNLVRRAPDPFIEASSYAFTPRLALEGIDRAIRIQEQGQRSIPGPIIADTLVEGARNITPSISEIEALVEAASEEDLLDEELVSMVLDDIQTGRDVIRQSRQFSRANIVGGINLESPKRTRKKTKTDRNMSKALRMSNERFRKKNGQLRKGVTQSQVMKYAHKLLKKM